MSENCGQVAKLKLNSDDSEVMPFSKASTVDGVFLSSKNIVLRSWKEPVKSFGFCCPIGEVCQHSSLKTLSLYLAGRFAPLFFLFYRQLV